MRIAIGQVWQETNTFNPLPTTRADFDALGVLRGADLVERMADTNELGGFIQSLRLWPERPEIVGLVRLAAWPSGPLTAEACAWMRDEVLSALRQSGPVDGVLLALHGALAADGTPDVEGELLDACRALLGPHVPLVATLDLHANGTARMVRAADALVLYHTAPHVDVFETGRRGAAVLKRILDGAQPVTAFQKLPLVLPAERANTQDPSSPACTVRQRLQSLERDPRVLSAGVATVQPWLDIPELGTAIVVTTDGDEALARRCCEEVSNFLWERRRDYLPELVSIKVGVRAAFAEPNGLVVLSDSADATTSGAPGDSNHLLREILHYDWPRPALVTLVDPDLVTDAARYGIGASLPALLGGKRDNRFSSPLAATVRVERLFDARFVLSGHLARNLSVDMGPSAVLSIGNIHIVVTLRTGPHFAPQLFTAAGLDPFAAQLLVAKSPCGFRAAYEGKARQIHVVRAPGCAPADFWTYPYHHLARPAWPWDDRAAWTPEPLVIGRGTCPSRKCANADILA